MSLFYINTVAKSDRLLGQGVVVSMALRAGPRSDATIEEQLL